MIQSVKKAMEIVDRVADKGRISVKELSDSMGIPKSTVCRLAQTLEASGYLYQDEASGDYFLAYKFFLAGREVLEKSGIRDCVWPVMQQLADFSKETVNLTVLDGNKVLYVQKIESSHITNGIQVGTRAPLHVTASGKAILASLAPDRLTQVMNDLLPLEVFTKRTIRTVEALRRELEVCRKRGFAISKDEIATGAYSIAAHIEGYPGRETAALSIAWPSNRTTPERFTEWGQLLHKACEEVSKKFKAY